MLDVGLPPSLFEVLSDYDKSFAIGVAIYPVYTIPFIITVRPSTQTIALGS
jgi:hypothetical protein